MGAGKSQFSEDELQDYQVSDNFNFVVMPIYISIYIP